MCHVKVKDSVEIIFCQSPWTIIDQIEGRQGRKDNDYEDTSSRERTIEETWRRFQKIDLRREISERRNVMISFNRI